jgi:tRNA A-37 threonylcarbamoyl transferase component Bud32
MDPPMPDKAIPDWRTRIDQETRPPRLHGSGRAVADVLRELASTSPEGRAGDPLLTPEDVQACLLFAAEVIDPLLVPAGSDEVATLPPAAQPQEHVTLSPAESSELLTVAPVESATLVAGRRIHVPGYEILGELGRGGMGVVYKARHLRLARIVALKMILAGEHASEDLLERFQREAEVIARLTHPGIVQIFEVGEHEGHSYLALEFLPGGSLASQLTDAPWSGPEAASLVEKLARAVHVAHQKGIVHRDLKPENVLLDEQGEPKITDFGLARKLDDGTAHTQTGAVMGTPSYMAPEQAAGKKGVGPRADVHALGGILHRLLGGKPPFEGPTTFDILMRVLEEEPAPLRQLNPKTPRDLETIVLKCLHKDPARRYQTAADLADDLARYQDGEPIRARGRSRLARSWRTTWKHPGLALCRVTVAVVFISLVILSAAGGWIPLVGCLWGTGLFLGMLRAPLLRVGFGALVGVGLTILSVVLLFGFGFEEVFRPSQMLLSGFTPQGKVVPGLRRDQILLACTLMLPLFLGALVGIASRERWLIWLPGFTISFVALPEWGLPEGLLPFLLGAQVAVVLAACLRLVRYWRGGHPLEILGGGLVGGVLGWVIGSCAVGGFFVLLFSSALTHSNSAWFITAFYGTVTLLPPFLGVILGAIKAADASAAANSGWSPGRRRRSGGAKDASPGA